MVSHTMCFISYSEEQSTQNTELMERRLSTSTKYYKTAIARI